MRYDDDLEEFDRAEGSETRREALARHRIRANARRDYDAIHYGKMDATSRRWFIVAAVMVLLGLAISLWDTIVHPAMPL